jgi:hypothetical protein
MNARQRTSKEFRRLSPDMAKLLEEGTRLRGERLRAADMWTIQEAATELPVDASELAIWAAAGRCIGVVGPAGEMKFPQWQFEPSIWFQIEAISEQLGTSDGWGVLSFLEVPSEALDGLTPRGVGTRPILPSFGGRGRRRTLMGAV